LWRVFIGLLGAGSGELTSNWAALVWGRTFSVDYRAQPLVVPEDFDVDCTAAAMRSIRGSTLFPETLVEYPRWSLFRSKRHTVVGLTCLASRLSDEKTRDAAGNLVHVFVGLVSRDPGAMPPPRDLELFRPLYRFVRDRWDEPETPEAQRSGRCPYVIRVSDSPLLGDLRSLNPEDDAVLVAPGSAGEALWWAAGASRVSLCLDLPTLDAAKAGPFQNVTVLDAVEETRIRREPPAAAPASARRRLLNHLARTGQTELRETPLPDVAPPPPAGSAPPELPQPQGTYARPRPGRRGS
jgi:hypothetical protein